MAEYLYPESSMRTNSLASMYSEIAMESYFHATEYYRMIQNKNYTVCSAYELSEMNKYVVKTVVFSAMSIESFLNDYAAACLGDSEFYSNFDKLSTISKFQLIAKFILKSPVEKDKTYYFYLKTLFALRDSYIHNKSTSFDTKGYKSLEEYLADTQEVYKEELFEESWTFDKNEINHNHRSATNALKAIKEIALYFDKNDARKIAMRRLFHPLGIQCGSEKEKEYKTMVFSELGIKVDEFYEFQVQNTAISNRGS